MSLNEDCGYKHISYTQHEKMEEGQLCNLHDPHAVVLTRTENTLWVYLGEFVVLTFADMPFVWAKYCAGGSGRGGVSLPWRPQTLVNASLTGREWRLNTAHIRAATCLAYY